MKQDDAASFPVIFTSLSTILLCFFIYLNTLSTGLSPQGASILSSIQRNFGVTHPKILDTESLQDDFSTIYPPEILNLGFPLKRQQNELAILLPRERIFLFNTAEIAADSVQSLHKLAALLASRSEPVSIDISQREDTSESWNITLQQLATLVRLVVDSGVSPQRLKPRAHPFQLDTDSKNAIVSLAIAAGAHR